MSLTTFHVFSTIHVLFLLGTVAVICLLLLLAYRIRGTPFLVRLEKLAGVANLLLWSGVNGWGMAPGQFDVARSLPLHICDITGLLASLVLLTNWRPFAVLLYFWGLGLSPQALLTPDLVQGPASIGFWLFWLSHSITIAIAVYLIGIRGFVPTWRDYLLAAAVSLGYFIVVFSLNAAFGFNYGYLGNSQPNQPTLLDFLGPWPQRTLYVAALAGIGMALLMLPWEVRRWWRRKSATSLDPKEGK
jgi:hypothetical integral membrane protein (TIGR02206 family)